LEALIIFNKNNRKKNKKEREKEREKNSHWALVQLKGVVN